MTRERWIMLGLAAVCALLIGGAWTIYDFARDRAQREADEKIRALNVQIENVIARASSDSVYYSDTLRLVARRVEQLEQERTRIDDALRFERRVTAELVVVGRELRDSVTALVQVDSADVRSASFTAEQPGLVITADVVMPLPPDSAHAVLAASIAPIPLTVVPGCGEATSGGLRPVLIAVEGPPWAPISVRPSSASPEFCNPLPRRIGTLERIRIGAPYAVGGALITLVTIAVLQLAM